MNEAQFLLSLGYEPQPAKEGLAAPPIIQPRHLNLGPPSAMVETRAEFAAEIDMRKGVAGRAFPSRAIGARMV